MKTIDIKTGKSYQVLVGKNLIKEAGKKIRAIKPYKKIAVITDDLVYRLHGDELKESLSKEGLQYEFFFFDNGEQSKNSNTLNKIYEFLTLYGISRTDLIVAFGGGVVGDVAGFAAATYLRGVDYIQIPTTLIAQTDSSVGGKTAIDTPLGKNLVGAFYQPKLVLCDVDMLSTLKRDVFNAAMAEVIKYALLSDSDLFSTLENVPIDQCLEEVVERCVQIKADVVAEDEFDTGKRMLLNLGHTMGHAVENHSHYTVSHGEGVAIGMTMMLKACVNHHMLDEGVYQRFLNLLAKFSLPTHYDKASLKELTQIAFHDKKRNADSISIVVCEGIGKCSGKTILLDDLYEFMS